MDVATLSATQAVCASRQLRVGRGAFRPPVVWRVGSGGGCDGPAAASAQLGTRRCTGPPRRRGADGGRAMVCCLGSCGPSGGWLSCRLRWSSVYAAALEGGVCGEWPPVVCVGDAGRLFEHRHGVPVFYWLRRRLLHWKARWRQCFRPRLSASLKLIPHGTLGTAAAGRLSVDGTMQDTGRSGEWLCPFGRCAHCSPSLRAQLGLLRPPPA